MTERTFSVGQEIQVDGIRFHVTKIKAYPQNRKRMEIEAVEEENHADRP